MGYDMTLRDFLEFLTPSEAKAMNLRWGLYNGHPRSPEEVGRIMGVSGDRIRQIELKIVRRIHRCTRRRDYRGFLDA